MFIKILGVRSIKYLGFDGKTYSVDFRKYVVREDKRKRSAPHIKVREILKELFPFDIVAEEFKLPGSKRGHGILYADFLVPLHNLMVEVHGEQHYVYNIHFHGSLDGFVKSKRRDNDKKEWCELNNISLAVIDTRLKEDEWRKEIERVRSE